MNRSRVSPGTPPGRSFDEAPLPPIAAVLVLYGSRAVTLGVLGWLAFGLGGLGLGLLAGAGLQLGRFVLAQLGRYRHLLGGEPAEIEWVRADVERLAGALGLPEPEIRLADAPVEDENAFMAFSPLRPHHGAMLVLERDWIRVLPQQILAAMIAHELGHLTMPALAYERAWALLTVMSRPALFLVGLMASMLNAGHQAWVGVMLALASGSLDLTRILLARKAELLADDVAVRLGYGAALDQAMYWAALRQTHRSFWRRLRLVAHPKIGSRSARLSRQLAASPEPIASPTYDGTRWHFPHRRALMTNEASRRRKRVSEEGRPR